ncbi:MAG: phage portal protein [Planctomycetota bacterium]
MAYRLEGFAGIGLSDEMLELLLSEHRQHTLPRLETLWRYFRNPLEVRGQHLRPAAPNANPGNTGAHHTSGLQRFRSAQEDGLPARLTGAPDPAAPLADDRVRPRREIVIENDIAWRIQTMIDFMFGKPVQILSTASDPIRRREIERVLDAVWEASGGIAMLQDAALTGHVFGHVDLVLRLNERLLAGGAARFTAALDTASGGDLAHLIRIETIDPRRGVPIISAADYRVIDGYVIHFDRPLNEVQPVAAHPPPHDRKSPLSRWRPFRRRSSAAAARRTVTTTEVLGPGRSQVYEQSELVRDRRSTLLPGIVPVVHIQNLSQPLAYPGLSEVEPLIPLQDELNTRLSDRASRVTMQSFKMYLAKRLEGFERTPIGPGLIWATDDPDASIETFGGDAESPSESEHIAQIREAMDKISAVPPLAGGVIRARVGNLSSATALRVTLLSLLSKTARKRVTYGRGIGEMSRMILAALDRSGAFRTEPGERGVRLIWPDPQGASEREEIESARGKIDLGIPTERVLSELGYAPSDPGIT